MLACAELTARLRRLPVSVAWSVHLVLLLLLPSCSRNLTIPGLPAPPPGGTVEAIVYVERRTPAKVCVRGEAMHDPPPVEDMKDAIRPPQQMTFNLPKGARVLKPGDWTFHVVIAPPVPGSEPNSTTCAPPSNSPDYVEAACSVTLMEGVQSRITVVEPFKTCTVDVGGQFSEEADLRVEPIDVTPPQPEIGSPVTVGVTVSNLGAGAAPGFDVYVTTTSRATGNAASLGSRNVPSLDPGGQQPLMPVTWDTAGFAEGNYDIKAQAPALPNELGTAKAFDNSATDQVFLAAGLDSDGDGVPDPRDTCPFHRNANQADTSACALKILFWPNGGGCAATQVCPGCDQRDLISLTQCIQLFGEGFDAGQTTVTVGGTLKVPGEVSFCDGGTRLIFPGPVGNRAVVLDNGNPPQSASAPVPNFCNVTPPCQPGPLAFTPVSGRAQTVVYVAGCFDPQVTTYTVQIGASPAVSATPVHSQFLRFSVPMNAQSGRIRVLQGGTPFGQETARAFKVEP